MQQQEARLRQSVQVVIETPAGSRNKYEFNPESGRFRLDRRMASSVVFPMDYGFVPGTLAPDGDPLDALVWLDQPTFPGCEIEAEPIAVLLMRDEGGRDDTIVCVPAGGEPGERVDELPGPLRDELAEFFSSYKRLEPGRDACSLGWGDRGQALGLVRRLRGAGVVEPGTGTGG